MPGSRKARAPRQASVRQAAHLDSFIRTLSQGAGNQVDMAEGGAAGIADRARNERMTRIIDNERLTRMQKLRPITVSTCRSGRSPWRRMAI